jgi:hypothetical protein
MITDSRDMIRAIRTNKFSGVVLYEGRSALTGDPIVAIANRIITASVNEKTGALVQSFIIRSDIDPLAATYSGADAAVCGDCQHRRTNQGTCYVNVGRSVATVFGAYKRGRYALPNIHYDPRILPDLFRNKKIRLGTYGDPAAIPFSIWRAVTLYADAVNGYSHQWRNPALQSLRTLCMASVDTPQEQKEAIALGWRTFRVRNATDPLLNYEIPCPASAEAGKKTVCETCKACGGLSAKAKTNIAIRAHGPTKTRFQ